MPFMKGGQEGTEKNGSEGSQSGKVRTTQEGSGSGVVFVAAVLSPFGMEMNRNEILGSLNCLVLGSLTLTVSLCCNISLSWVAPSRK